MRAKSSNELNLPHRDAIVILGRVLVSAENSGFYGSRIIGVKRSSQIVFTFIAVIAIIVQTIHECLWFAVVALFLVLEIWWKV